MNTNKVFSLITRYIAATAGMFLVAVGIAISIIANLGTAPLSCPSYVLNLRFPSISVGMFTFLVNCLFILFQLALLRKDFKLSYLMQIPASLIFGSLIDLSLSLLSWLHPAGLLSSYLLLGLSCLISALGISIEVKADAWMLSAEMTAFSMSHAFGKPFSNMKVVMDCLVLLAAALLSLLFFGSVLGDGTSNVIGLGTLILAIFIGLLMKLTDPLIAAVLRLFKRN